MEKTAFLFPGQGSQFVGMTKTLYDKYDIARQVFEEANDTLGFDVKKMCFEGTAYELNLVENMLPALLTASFVVFKSYMDEIGTQPVLSAGHSLGEYSALVCAGAFNFADALRIVRFEGIIAGKVKDSCNGAMTIVDKAVRGVLEDECRKIHTEADAVYISCYNAPNQFAIAGNEKAVAKVEDRLMELDAQVTPLLMSPPFHCPLMQAVSEELKTELEKCAFNQFKWPVISNVTARPYSEPDLIVPNLTAQIYQPVQWDATMKYLQKEGITKGIEMGPQSVLTDLLKLNTPGIRAYSFGQLEDRTELLQHLSVHGATTSKEPVQANPMKLITRCLAIAVCTRNYNWDTAKYDQGAVEPYEKIERMQAQLEKEGLAPTTEQMNEALEMLRSVFITKKTPVDTQVRRFNQIFTETGARELFPEFKMPGVQ